MLVACAVRSPEAPLQVPPAPETIAAAASVRLFREVLRFRITGATVEGLGFYYFHNDDAVARAFPAAFSFIVAAWQGPPRRLQFMRVSADENEDLPFVWLEKNYPLTNLFIPPGEDCCLRVGWEQEVSQGRFVYRFKRQPPWNPDREHVRLTLLVPDDFRDVRTNFPVSYRFNSETQQALVFVRDDFVPTEDYVVSWKR